MIVAFVSRKGGVGKTTTAVSLAAAFAALGRRTLLVDLDSQASASLSLGVARGDLAPSASDVLRGRLPIDEAIRPPGTPGLSLLTGSIDLMNADLELAPLRNREARLRERLEPARRSFDLILLDCQPSLSALPANALVAADTFIVPVVPHFLALEGIDVVLDTAERLSLRYGTRLRLLGLLLTMVDYRTRAAREAVAGLRSVYGERVFGIEVRLNVRLAEAPARGRTIFEHDPLATGALNYRLLADEVLQRAGLLTPALSLV